VSLIREQRADIAKGTAVVVLSDAASVNEVESFRSAVFGRISRSTILCHRSDRIQPVRVCIASRNVALTRRRPWSDLRCPLSCPTHTA